MKVLFLTTVVFTLSGCASIVSESKYPVSVNSEPRGAHFEVRNKSGNVVASGATPSQVTLNAGAGYFRGETYQVSYRKEGYSDQQSVIDSGIDGWYWGNLLFGGLLGMLILDPVTGAMYKLPNNTSTSLYPVPVAAETVKDVATSGSQKPSTEQQLNELANDKSLSYEEYQRRYRLIMSQQ